MIVDHSWALRAEGIKRSSSHPTKIHPLETAQVEEMDAPISYSVISSQNLNGSSKVFHPWFRPPLFRQRSRVSCHPPAAENRQICLPVSRSWRANLVPPTNDYKIIRQCWGGKVRKIFRFIGPDYFTGKIDGLHRLVHISGITKSIQPHRRCNQKYPNLPA